MNESNIELQNQFKELFSVSGTDRLVVWKETSYVGVSIIKRHKANKYFTPAKNALGEIDSVVLIKIAFNPEEINKDSSIVPLIIKVSTASDYLLNGKMWHNFEDPKSPTKESLKISEESTQPVSLEENKRYTFNTDSKKFIDTKKNKIVSSKFIINEIYKSHIKTLSDPIFRLKKETLKIIIKSIDPIIEFLKIFNDIFFGRTIITPKTTESGRTFFEGYDQYPIESLIEHPLKRPEIEKTNNIKLFENKLPITIETGIRFSFFNSLIFIIHHVSNFKFNYFYFFQTNNSFFNAILIITYLMIFNEVIDQASKIIFKIINYLIKIKYPLMNTKINIS